MGIPAQYAQRDSSDNWQELALWLTEIGWFIRPSDNHCALAEYVQTGLNLAFRARIKELNWFKCSLSIGQAGSLFYQHHDGWEAQLDPIEMTNGLIGEGLAKYEAILPGVSQIIFLFIRQASYATLPIFAPDSAFDIASWLNWQSEREHEEVVATLQQEYMEDPEALENMVLPNHFKEAYPHSWVYDPVRIEKTVIEQMLTSLQSHADPQLRVLGTLLDSMHMMLCNNSRLFSIEVEDENPVHYITCLRWNSNDELCHQMLDDHYQYASESGDGFTDALGKTTIEHSQSAWFEFLTKFERGFKLLAALDQLLDLIAIKENE